MTLRIYRVTVRGRFDGLTDEARAALRQRQPEHDVVANGAFTEDGTLTYERAVDFFTFRFQLRARADDPADAEAAVADEARQRAEHHLSGLGVGWRDVKVKASDMASVWQ